MVLDPTSATSRAPAQQHALAPRARTSLDGVRLGLLANSKRNSAELLDAIADLLAEHGELQSVVRREKPSESLPVPEEMANELEEQCDIVITAIGD